VARGDNEADLKINVAVDAKKAQTGLDSAAKKVHGFAGHMKTLTAGILGADALKNAASAVWDFGKKAVQAYGMSQQKAVMYSDAMKRIPGASDAATAALMDQAAALGQVTTFGKGTVKQGQAVLASFGLTAKQIEKLTPLMLDYSTKTGQDVTASAKQLGRALMGQGRALKNIGIDFKDTGTLQGNFDQLTRELDKSVGGLAKQMGATSAGQMEIMKNQLKALTVAIGKWLYPWVQKLIEGLIDLVKWIQKNSQWLIPLVGTITAFAGAFLAVAAAIKIATAAKKAFAAVKMFAKTNPAALIIAGVVALIVVIKQLYDHWEWFHKAVDAVWQAIQVAWDATVGAIKVGIDAVVAAIKWLWDKFDWYFKGIWEIVKKYINLITLPFRIAFDVIKAIVSGDFDKVLAIFKGIPRRVIDALSGLFNAVTAPFKKAIDWVIGLLPSLWDWFKKIPGWISSALSTVYDVITAPFRRAMDAVRNIVQGAVDWVSRQFDRIKGFATDAINFVKGIYNGMARMWNSVEVKMPEVDTHIPGVGKIGGWTLGLPDLPIWHAKGGFANTPTIAGFGEAGPEWILPERRLAALLKQAAGGGNVPTRSAPAVVLEHATFAAEVDVDAFLRRAAWTVRTQGI